jgi:hypothetical protein
MMDKRRNDTIKMECNKIANPSMDHKKSVTANDIIPSHQQISSEAMGRKRRRREKENISDEHQKGKPQNQEQLKAAEKMIGLIHEQIDHHPQKAMDANDNGPMVVDFALELQKRMSQLIREQYGGGGGGGVNVNRNSGRKGKKGQKQRVLFMDSPIPQNGRRKRSKSTKECRAISGDASADRGGRRWSSERRGIINPPNARGILRQKCNQHFALPNNNSDGIIWDLSLSEVQEKLNRRIPPYFGRKMLDLKRNSNTSAGSNGGGRRRSIIMEASSTIQRKNGRVELSSINNMDNNNLSSHPSLLRRILSLRKNSKENNCKSRNLSAGSVFGMIISAAAAEQKIHNDLIGSRLSGLTQKNEQDHQWILKRALRNQQSREQILQANKYNTNSAIFWVAI